MTAGLAAALDKAYAERIASGFFDEETGTETVDNAAQLATPEISATFPELALSASAGVAASIAASLAQSSAVRASAVRYESCALAVAESAREAAGGSYSEYSIVQSGKAANPDSAAFVSATSVHERSIALGERASAVMTAAAMAQAASGQGNAALIAAQETRKGLSYWSQAEALLNAAGNTSRTGSQQNTPSDEHTLRQSWLSYGTTQDALLQGLMQRFLADKDAWLTSAEAALARPDTKAQFLGTDADTVARTYIAVVVPKKNLGQVTAEHREAESASSIAKTKGQPNSSDEHPAGGQPLSGQSATAQSQKPNLLQKALQFLKAIVQSKPMEKVESSNRGSAAQAPIFRDHGIHLMRQEEGTGGVAGTSDNTAGTSSSGRSSGSSTKKNTQQAAVAEVNNTAEPAEPATSPINETKELEKEKAAVRQGKQTTEQAATEEAKKEPKKTASQKAAERAEALEPATTTKTSTAPHDLGMDSAGASDKAAPVAAPPNSSRKGAEKAETVDTTTINTKAAPEAAPPNSSRKGAEKAEALEVKKSETKTNSVTDKFLAPLQRQEPVMLSDNSNTNNLANLEGIVGFKIDNSSSKKTITPQDYKYSNQRSDIDAPTDLYCVYTTEWNSYKNTYLVATGVELTKEQAILARENALKDEAINEAGRVKSYLDLARSFNTTFGTNYGYKYTEEYVQKIPATMYPTIQSDSTNKTTTLEFPHVRYKNSAYAHTTNYLGDNKVFDVWDGKEKDISGKGKVDKTAEGWDERYGEDGSYRVGYHTWYIYN